MLTSGAGTALAIKENIIIGNRLEDANPECSGCQDLLVPGRTAEEGPAKRFAWLLCVSSELAFILETEGSII